MTRLLPIRPVTALILGVRSLEFQIFLECLVFSCGRIPILAQATSWFQASPPKATLEVEPKVMVGRSLGMEAVRDKRAQ